MKRLGIVLAAFVAASAFAQDVQPDPSQGTGPQPSTPQQAKVIPICSDRPTKASVACTVPEGDVQIESDLINWTRQTQDRTRTDTILYTNPTFKIGLGSHTDIEAMIAPHESVRTRNPDGSVDRISGVGDLYLRVKQRLTADDAKTQVSIIPYIKAPTARAGVGNGLWEGGLTAAANIPIPAKFTLTLAPEIDMLADDDGRGHHASLTMLANLSHALTDKITLYGEFWTQQNFDPAQTERQYSLDTALTYQIATTWQVDVGGNFGLNRETPAAQLYLGLSTRF